MRNLNPDTRENICMMLNTRLNGKDFRTLGNLMKLMGDEIKELDLNNNPTEALLQKWELRKGSTVETLNKFLLKMKRHDVIQEILKRP